MKWLSDFITKNHFFSMLLPMSASAIQFLMSFIHDVSDGSIDPSEFHNLTQSASGFETIVMIIIMWAIKKSGKVL